MRHLELRSKLLILFSSRATIGARAGAKSPGHGLLASLLVARAILLYGSQASFRRGRVSVIPSRISDLDGLRHVSTQMGPTRERSLMI